MHYKIPYITGFVDKYTVPINHDIDLDSIKIRKRDKDGTFGKMVYNFKVDCSSIPIIIFVEDSCEQEYFLKYSYLTKRKSFKKIKFRLQQMSLMVIQFFVMKILSEKDIESITMIGWSF